MLDTSEAASEFTKLTRIDLVKNNPTNLEHWLKSVFDNTEHHRTLETPDHLNYDKRTGYPKKRYILEEVGGVRALHWGMLAWGFGVTKMRR
jgi:hypothetical protein